MAAFISGLSAALLQREKLVTQINEGRGAAFAPKLEVEQSTIEGQSLSDVADLERHTRFEMELKAGNSRSVGPLPRRSYPTRIASPFQCQAR
jgi:hypothetical protein